MKYSVRSPPGPAPSPAWRPSPRTGPRLRRRCRRSPPCRRFEIRQVVRDEVLDAVVVQPDCIEQTRGSLGRAGVGFPARGGTSTVLGITPPAAPAARTASSRGCSRRFPTPPARMVDARRPSVTRRSITAVLPYEANRLQPLLFRVPPRLSTLKRSNRIRYSLRRKSHS